MRRRTSTDLDSRLTWLIDHDRGELVDLLAAVVPADALRDALCAAERVTETGRGPCATAPIVHGSRPNNARQETGDE